LGQDALVVTAEIQSPSSGVAPVLLGEACMKHTEAWNTAEHGRHDAIHVYYGFLAGRSALHMAARLFDGCHAALCVNRRSWPHRSTARGLRFSAWTSIETAVSQSATEVLHFELVLQY